MEETKKLVTFTLGAALIGGLIGGLSFYGIAAATIPLEAGPQGAQGEQGPEGPAGRNGTNGSDGKNATVKAGTVTTLTPDKDATVTNAGTPNNAVLNFGIPQGKTGATGPAGPQGKTGTVTSLSSIPGWPANCASPTVQTVRVGGTLLGQSDYDIMVLSCGTPPTQ